MRGAQTWRTFGGHALHRSTVINASLLDEAKGSPMLACYTDRLSVRPGERFDLHASAANGPCRLTVARVGAKRHEVLALTDVVVGEHPAPPNADRDGCGWPVALQVEVGAD